MFMTNCSGTFQNVPVELLKMFLNIQKGSENELAKHFKLLSEICMNIFKCSIGNLNFLKFFMTRFVGEHFRLFVGTFKLFVNTQKCFRNLNTEKVPEHI